MHRAWCKKKKLVDESTKVCRMSRPTFVQLLNFNWRLQRDRQSLWRHQSWSQSNDISSHLTGPPDSCIHAHLFRVVRRQAARVGLPRRAFHSSAARNLDAGVVTVHGDRWEARKKQWNLREMNTITSPRSVEKITVKPGLNNHRG